MENNSAYRSSVELVKAAIQSGGIKLLGPQRSGDAIKNAEADAAYLVALLEHLSKTLPDSDSEE